MAIQFDNYSDADLDNLQNAGQLSADTVARIKQARGPQGIAPTQQASVAANSGPLPQVMEQPVSVQQLPIQQNPLQQNAEDINLQQPLGMGLQNSIQNPNAINQSMIDPLDQMIEDEKATRQMAVQTAQEKSMMNSQIQAQRDNEKAIEDAANKDAADTAMVAADLNEDKENNWGSKIGQAIAIMMGAYSQGLTGNKENPAITAIDKELERQANQKKYTEEQRLKQADLMYKKAQQEIEKRKANIDSMIGLKKLEQADQELALKRGEIQQKYAEKNLMQKKTYSQDEVQQLPKDITDKIVRLPDGSYAPAINKDSAERLNKIKSELGPAISGAQRVLDIANDPNFSRLSLTDRARASIEVKALVGQLRIPFTGPGQLTDKEYDRLMDTIGNPSKLATLPSIEKAKLETLVKKLNMDMNLQYNNAGIDIPKSREEKEIEFLIKKNPNVPQSAIIEMYQRQKAKKGQ